MDTRGHVQVMATSTSSLGGPKARRINRTATLDGSAVVNDFGHSYADRTFDVRWPPMDRVADDLLSRMVTLYGMVIVSMPEGCFLAALESYEPGKNESSLRLLVIESLTE
jgi:hypothetical protein